MTVDIKIRVPRCVAQSCGQSQDLPQSSSLSRYGGGRPSHQRLAGQGERKEQRANRVWGGVFFISSPQTRGRSCRICQTRSLLATRALTLPRVMVCRSPQNGKPLRKRHHSISHTLCLSQTLPVIFSSEPTCRGWDGMGWGARRLLCPLSAHFIRNLLIAMQGSCLHHTFRARHMIWIVRVLQVSGLLK